MVKELARKNDSDCLYEMTESLYYNDKVDDAQNDSKAVFRIVCNLLHKHNSPISHCDSLAALAGRFSELLCSKSSQLNMIRKGSDVMITPSARNSYHVKYSILLRQLKRKYAELYLVRLMHPVILIR